MSQTIIQKIKQFVKTESVLFIASLLAFFSCFLVPPDKEYISYIDFHTLSLLFCLMCVMAGLKSLGLFQAIGESLLGKVHSQRGIAAILICLCFFSSMLITNDVALITFVPFGLLVLKIADLEKDICSTVALMTIAANLGSMLTPIGNPQNLYLYSISGMSFPAFLKLMLPYTLLSALLLGIFVLVLHRRSKSITYTKNTPTPFNRKRVVFYLVLFFFCLLCVAKVLSVYLLLPVLAIAVFLENRKLLLQVDYCLLLTFVAFFIFIGNMGRIPMVSTWLSQVINGHEITASVLSSQVISNVPAALLLSGFTSKWDFLIIGTNLGGLGTLIASMASLISYKAVTKEKGKNTKSYFGIFTLYNILFLLVLFPLALYFTSSKAF